MNNIRKNKTNNINTFFDSASKFFNQYEKNYESYYFNKDRLNDLKTYLENSEYEEIIKDYLKEKKPQINEKETDTKKKKEQIELKYKYFQKLYRHIQEIEQYKKFDIPYADPNNLIDFKDKECFIYRPFADNPNNPYYNHAFLVINNPKGKITYYDTLDYDKSETIKKAEIYLKQDNKKNENKLEFVKNKGKYTDIYKELKTKYNNNDKEIINELESNNELQNQIINEYINFSKEKYDQSGKKTIDDIKNKLGNDLAGIVSRKLPFIQESLQGCQESAINRYFEFIKKNELDCEKEEIKNFDNFVLRKGEGTRLKGTEEEAEKLIMENFKKMNENKIENFEKDKEFANLTKYEEEYYKRLKNKVNLFKEFLVNLKNNKKYDNLKNKYNKYINNNSKELIKHIEKLQERKKKESSKERSFIF